MDHLQVTACGESDVAHITNVVSDLEMDLLFMFLQVSLVRKLRPTNTASVVCHYWNELSGSSVNSVVLTLPRPRAPWPLS